MSKIVITIATEVDTWPDNLELQSLAQSLKRAVDYKATVGVENE